MKTLHWGSPIKGARRLWPDRSQAPNSAEGVSNASSSYSMRDASEIWIMSGIGLISFTVYLLTLSPGTCPGVSAIAIGKALSLLPAAPATHPLWLAASRIVGAVPIFDTVLRLNLFSAVCGSLAAAWLFRITKRVIFEFIRDAPAIRLVPVDEMDQVEILTVAPSEEIMELVYASLGGIIAAFSFAFCAPVWVASTSLHVEPFNILLLLFTVDLLSCYHFTARTSVCVAAMFLLGLGLVESVIFVILAPLALVLVLVSGMRYNQISESFILLLLAACSVGLASNLILFLLLSSWGHAFSSTVIFGLLASLAHAHESDLLVSLPKSGWVIVLLQTTLPILVALVSVRLFSSLQDEATRWKWGVTNLIFSAFASACLLNFPKSSWSMAREVGYLPIMPCLTIAIAAGALFVYWCLVAAAADSKEYRDPGASSRNLRLLGFGMCGILGLVTVRTLHINFSDSDSRKATFADRIADEILLQAGSAQCLITDGTLDLNLLIRSHLTGKKIVLVPCLLNQDQETEATSERKAPFSLILPKTQPTQKLSPETFIEQWLQKNPKEHDQVVSIGNPELWQHAGLFPLPNGLICVGTDDKSTLNEEALLAGNRIFWQQFEPLLAEDRTLRPELRYVHDRVRTHASRMANDLGALLEQAGDLTGAEDAYSAANRLDDKNLCAGLNREGLRLRGKGNTESSRAFFDYVAKLTARPDFFDSFDTAVSRYGRLTNQEADRLLPAVMFDYTIGTKLPANMIRLLEKWLGASHPIPQCKAQPIAVATHTSDTTQDAMLSQSLSMLLNGQDIKAEKRLRALVGARPNNLSAWALLAEILMNRGQLQEVNEVILPAMRSVRISPENADSTLIDMTQGCLLLRSASPNPAEARRCFEHALAKNPTLNDASDKLLHVDRVLGNSAYLEEDALKIVSNNPDHADANAILGSLRLSQKRYADAEAYLRRSIKVAPTAGTLNDLAELLLQQDRLTEAEQQARLAIRLSPDFYPAWDTLGNILIEEGLLSEAYGPLRCAFALSSNDPRLFLTLTRLHIKEGRLREANQVLDQSRPMFSQTSLSARNEFAELKQQLKNQLYTP